MQVSSGYGIGQYAQQGGAYDYLNALTTSRDSASSFYIASNGWLTPYPDHTDYNDIVVTVDEAGGAIYIQAAESKDPSVFDGSGALSCASLPPTGGPLSCQPPNGGMQFQWCGDFDSSNGDFFGVSIGSSVQGGCQAQTYNAVPLCVVAS